MQSTSGGMTSQHPVGGINIHRDYTAQYNPLIRQPHQETSETLYMTRNYPQALPGLTQTLVSHKKSPIDLNLHEDNAKLGSKIFVCDK